MDDIDNMSDVFSTDPVRSRQAIHSIADALKHIQSAEGNDPDFEERNFLHNLDVVFNNGDLTAEAKILKIVQAYSKFSAVYGNDAKLILAIEEKFLQRGWSNVNVDTLERLYSEIIKLSNDLKEQWYTCRHCVINYPEDKFQCTSCDSNFFHFVSLQFHISKSHVSLAANSNMSCPECGMFFNRDISAMKNHYEDEHLCRRGHETCPVGCRSLLPVGKSPEDSVFQHIARNHVCTVCNEKTIDTNQHLLLFHDIDSPENDDEEHLEKSYQERPSKSSAYDISSLRSNKHPKRGHTGSMEKETAESSVKKAQVDDKMIECQICGFDIPLNGFPCKLCPEKFDYHVDTLMHMRKEHRMKIDFSVECGVCQIEGSLTEMHYHLTTKHSCISSHLRCPRDCNKLFESEDDIMHHLKISHGVGSESTESKSSESSKRHSKSKNGDLEKGSFDLRDKLRVSSTSNGSRSHRDRSIEKPKRKDVMSSTTPKSFAEWEEFIEAMGPMNLGLPGFSVQLAPIQRISMKAISYHSNKLKCQKCKLKYPKNLLSCSECGDVFCTPGSLAFHQNSMHEIVLDKYYCDCCAETFSTCNDLIVHELSKVCNNHYECPFGCDCLFTHQAKLLDHIKTHHSSSIAPSTANMMPFGLSTYKKNSQNTAKFSCEKCRLICLPEENWAYCKLCEDRGHKLKMRIKYVVGLEFLTHLVRFHKLNVAMKLYCVTCKEPFTDVLDFHSHQKQNHGFCGIHVACPAEGCGVITHVPHLDKHTHTCRLFREQFANGVQVSDTPDVISNEPFSLSKPIVEKQILSAVSYSSNQPVFHASNSQVQMAPKFNPNFLMPPAHMPNFVSPVAPVTRPRFAPAQFFHNMPVMTPRLRAPYRLPLPKTLQPSISRKRAPMAMMPQPEMIQTMNSMPAVVHDLIDETVEYAAERKARKMMSNYASNVSFLAEQTEDVVPLQKGSILGTAPDMTPDELFRPREQRVIMSGAPKLAERHMASMSQPQTLDEQAQLGDPQYSADYLNDKHFRSNEADSKRKIGKCNKCHYKYEVSAMSFDHFCEECELYFIKDYELLIHLTVIHAVETEDISFSCDICPENDQEYDLSDLLAHRTEKHEACLAHMRCPNDPCNFMFSTVEEMNKHSKNTCRNRDRDRSRIKVLKPGASKSKTVSVKEVPRSSSTKRDEDSSSTGRSLKRIKPSDESGIGSHNSKPQAAKTTNSSESNIISFDESKRYFRTKNPVSAEGRTHGCLDCGQVKPADKYFDCRLCDQTPGVRVSEKQFALFLEALIHLVTKHDFIITDVNQSCKSPECINEFGEQLVFDSVEEYHFHGVKNHGLCRRHFLCPYACGSVFTDSKEVSPHMRFCFLGSRKSNFKTSLVLPTV